MCEIWKRLGEEPGSREDRQAYWHHPLRRLCEQLEQHLGIPRDDLEKAALRLNSALGLRGMDPFPNPDGTDGDPGLPNWLSMLPKFKALDRDGTTARLWESLSEAYQDELGELCEDVSPAPSDGVHDTDSAWVTAAILWPERFRGRKGPKGLDRFREEHPEMFRNPTRYKLEIHAGRWVTYWHQVEQNSSESLGEPPESIADDPEAQTEFLEGAADRIAKLRGEKKPGQQ